MRKQNPNSKFFAAVFFIIAVFHSGMFGNSYDQSTYELSFEEPIKIIDFRFQWMLEIQFRGKLLNARNENIWIEAVVSLATGEPLKDLDGKAANNRVTRNGATE